MTEFQDLFYSRFPTNFESSYLDFEYSCLQCFGKGFFEMFYKYENKNILKQGIDIITNIRCSNGCTIKKTDILPKNINCVDKYGVEFYLNNEGFRSDDFTKSHTGKHILFAGCSNTFGFSTEKEKTWPFILYNKIKEKEKVSGYYNLSHVGGRVSEIVSNIFIYCKKYSKPDVIFFLMPTVGREISLTEKQFELYQDNEEEMLLQIIFLQRQSMNYYLMLEEYCKTNNIKLISTTWDFNDDFISTDETFKNFKTYYINKIEEHKENVHNYIQNNKNDKFYETAKDGLHFGNSLMYSFSEIFYNKYLELK